MKQYINPERGQTIIETVIALSILTAGIGASVSLATHSLSASTSITKQLIGTGLAREAQEAVRNMRDTNWLKGTLNDPVNNPPGCTDFSGGQGAACYKDWENIPSSKGGYNISPVSGGQTCTETTPSSSFWDLIVRVFGLSFAEQFFSSFKPVPVTTCVDNGPVSGFSLDYDQTTSPTSRYWTLTPETAGYRLLYDANAASGRFYNTESGIPSDYFRQVTITEESTNYSAADLGPRIRITVKVWWTDKNCPYTETFPTKGSCGIKLESYLTNWKNY